MAALLDTILVSISKEKETDDPVLIVGRKNMNNPVEIVNAFQGDEAMELYNRLVTKKGE